MQGRILNSFATATIYKVLDEYRKLSPREYLTSLKSNGKGGRPKILTLEDETLIKRVISENNGKLSFTKAQKHRKLEALIREKEISRSAYYRAATKN